MFFDNISPEILVAFDLFGETLPKNSQKTPPEGFFGCFFVGFCQKVQYLLKIIGLKLKTTSSANIALLCHALFATGTLAGGAGGQVDPRARSQYNASRCAGELSDTSCMWLMFWESPNQGLQACAGKSQMVVGGRT